MSRAAPNHLTIASLNGAGNRRLSLTLIQYQLPDPELRVRVLQNRNRERGDGPRVVFTRWDASWLLVRVDASDERLGWSIAEPTFLTRELRSLVQWLRRVADTVTGEAHLF
jgi:hypothetical protein